MNKPRPSALPLQKAIRVSPPTAPGFFSFHSFRVKKGQQKQSDSSDSSTRRRTASGDCEHPSSSWASVVVSPLAPQKDFTRNGNGRLSTFRTFSSVESAPCSPCTGQEYRFVKGTIINITIVQSNLHE